MHFSAKRGIEIACRLSVCLSVRPSVTLVDQDHIGWKSWKLTARTLSPTPSLFEHKGHPPTSRGTLGNFERPVRTSSVYRAFSAIIAHASKALRAPGTRPQVCNHLQGSNRKSNRKEPKHYRKPNITSD